MLLVGVRFYLDFAFTTRLWSSKGILMSCVSNIHFTLINWRILDYQKRKNQLDKVSKYIIWRLLDLLLAILLHILRFLYLFGKREHKQKHKNNNYLKTKNVILLINVVGKLCSDIYHSYITRCSQVTTKKRIYVLMCMSLRGQGNIESSILQYVMNNVCGSLHSFRMHQSIDRGLQLTELSWNLQLILLIRNRFFLYRNFLNATW